MPLDMLWEIRSETGQAVGAPESAEQATTQGPKTLGRQYQMKAPYMNSTAADVAELRWNLVNKGRNRTARITNKDEQIFRAHV